MNRHIVFILLILATAACDSLLLGDSEQLVVLGENLSIPPDLNDGWEVSTPEAENIDAEMVASAVRFIHENEQANIHSMLIVRHNKLVVESYYNGWNRNRRHDLRSATKSITSCLMGIAIDQQLVASVDEPVYEFFPEYESFGNWDDRKTLIPIRHFLQMRTGFDCNDMVPDSRGNEERMYQTFDWVKFVLDLPMVTESGKNFSYCTGAPVVLGTIVSHTSGMTIPAYSEKYLFSELGINSYQWEEMPNGNTDTGGHIHLTPRDMAKFGLLFLNNGKWKGKQIVSESWVAESTAPTDSISQWDDKNSGYGYLWWTRNWIVKGTPVPSYYANGNGGQFIFVFPDFDMVVVFTGGKYNQDSQSVPFGLLRGKILPALD